MRPGPARWSPTGWSRAREGVRAGAAACSGAEGTRVAGQGGAGAVVERAGPAGGGGDDEEGDGDDGDGDDGRAENGKGMSGWPWNSQAAIRTAAARAAS